MPQPFPYSKLPGRRRGFLVSGSLWLGADHFLSVKNLRFTEDYKRFYFRDVQAIVIRKTPRFYVPTPWLVALFATLFAMAVTGGLHRQAWTQILLFPLIGIVLWVGFTALFSSCRCHIQTAVSREEIPALVRLRDARRAVEILAGKIAETQGALPENWVLDEPEETPASLPAALPAEALPAHVHLGMRLALAAFLFMLGDAVFTYFQMHKIGDWRWQRTGTVLMLVEATVMISSLVFLRGAKPVRTMTNLVIAGIVFAGGTYYVSYTATIGITTLQQSHTISAGNPQSFPVMFWIDVVNEAGNTALGIAGLAAWSSARKKMT